MTNKRKTDKEIYSCLEYCNFQNGRPDCKNCGLTQDMIDDLIDQVRREERERIQKLLLEIENE